MLIFQFMYLTVPLPIAQTRIYKCLFVPLDPEKPQIQLKVLIPSNAPFSQVKERIASVMQCKAGNVSRYGVLNTLANNVVGRFRPVARIYLRLVERL